MKKNPEISLLLGAGFSVPMGYPSAKDVNDFILDYRKLPISFSLAGEITTSTDVSTPFFEQKNPHEVAFDNCLGIIKLYKDVYGEFDYEQFYDFMKFGYKDSDCFNEFFSDYFSQNQNIDQLMSSIHYIYEQMVQFLIKDGRGQRFYDVNDCTRVFPIYEVFLEFLHGCLGKGIVVNVHSLNHDLLFESFNLSGILKGNICDGFDDTNSHYWAEIRNNYGNHECLLKKYTGQYDKLIRLYKLHGSIDYIPYKKTVDGCLQYDNYLKIPAKTSLFSFFLKNENGEIIDRDFTHYHSDFLSGVIYKRRRYEEPFYEGLFKSFENNLQNSDLLIIIGYSGKDVGINECIKKCYDFLKKPIFIIDPYPNSIFAGNIKAHPIKKGIDFIIENDVESFTRFL